MLCLCCNLLSMLFFFFSCILHLFIGVFYLFNNSTHQRPLHRLPSSAGMLTISPTRRQACAQPFWSMKVALLSNSIAVKFYYWISWNHAHTWKVIIRLFSSTFNANINASEKHFITDCVRYRSLSLRKFTIAKREIHTMRCTQTCSPPSILHHTQTHTHTHMHVCKLSNKCVHTHTRMTNKYVCVND